MFGEDEQAQEGAAIETGRIRLRLDLGYDGTAFHGWAAQPGLRTVQQTLEDAIALIFEPGDSGPSVSPRLTVAGRTDTGVHARGQVAHLDVPAAFASRISERRLNAILNQQYARLGASSFAPTLNAPASIPAPTLTSDVVVNAVAIAPDGFDARFSAVSRRYEYRLRPQGVLHDPLNTRYTADVPRSLDMKLMQQASDQLIGLHDFAAFCKARAGSTSVRELSTFEWRRNKRGIFVARIEADAFCHSMVRALVGAVVSTGSGKISLAELSTIRDGRQRTSRFTVMPARGLSLEQIVYPPDADLAIRAELTRARRAPLI